MLRVAYLPQMMWQQWEQGTGTSSSSDELRLQRTHTNQPAFCLCLQLLWAPSPMCVSRPPRYGRREREQPSWVCPIRTRLLVVAVAGELPPLGCHRGRSRRANEIRHWRCCCRESACFLCSTLRFAIKLLSFSAFVAFPRSSSGFASDGFEREQALWRELARRSDATASATIKICCKT